MVKWKPMTFDNDAFVGNLEGLAGIEEATEYNLNEFRYKPSKVKDKKKPTPLKEPSISKVSQKSKKRKVKSVAQNDQTIEEPSTSTVSQKSKKIKVKSVAQNDKSLEESSTSTVSQKVKKRKVKSVAQNDKTLEEPSTSTVSQKVIKRKAEFVVDDETTSKKQKVTKVVKGLKKKKKKLRQNNAEEQKSKSEETSPSETETNYDFFNEMKSWEPYRLREEIVRALHDKGFYEPTEIQKLSLGPSVLGLRDILGAAETGSGKTLAFGIPIIQGILNLADKLSEKGNDEQEDIPGGSSDESDWESNKNMGCVKVQNFKSKNTEKNKLMALVLTPTRELAVQVEKHLKDICKYTTIKTALVVGGLSQQKQERLLGKRPEIIVATPGRLWDIMSYGHQHLRDVDQIRYLAIDETDRMLEKGHFEHLLLLLEKLNFSEQFKQLRQNFVFSATLTVVHDPPNYSKGKKRKKLTSADKIESLTERIGIVKPKVIDLTTSSVICNKIEEFKVTCAHEAKDVFLYYFLLEHRGRTLVFCNSISCVRRIANILTFLQLKPLPLHSGMEQRQRLKNLDRFRDSDTGLLLATEVAARGLDIPNIQNVVHYQVPQTVESYVHRSGRTARGSNQGVSLLIMEPKESKRYFKILSNLNKSKDIPNLEVDGDLLHSVKARVTLAQSVDELSLAYKKKHAQEGWYDRAIRDMDILVDDDDIPKKLKTEVRHNMKRDLDIKTKQLKNLLAAPIVPKNFSGKYPGFNAMIPNVNKFKKLKHTA